MSLFYLETYLLDLFSLKLFKKRIVVTTKYFFIHRKFVFRGLFIIERVINIQKEYKENTKIIFRPRNILLFLYHFLSFNFYNYFSII